MEDGKAKSVALQAILKKKQKKEKNFEKSVDKMALSPYNNKCSAGRRGNKAA